MTAASRALQDEVEWPFTVQDLESCVRRHDTLRSADKRKTCKDCHCANCSGTEIGNKWVYNQHSNLVEVSTLTKGGHNALQLSKAVETLLKRPLCLSSPCEIESFTEFRYLLNDHSANSLMRRLGAKDGREVLPGEYQYILHLLSGMFLPGKVTIEFEFFFAENAYGEEEMIDGTTYVRLHPLLVEDLHHGPPEGSVLNDRAMSRLNTLLHEAVHAFLDAYSCQSCPCRGENMENFRGHGFAWQRIAHWMEIAAYNSLGLRMTMARMVSITLTGTK